MSSKLKYIFALVVAIYLVNNIGIPVFYHYCGGELESVNGVCKSDGCCDEEEEDEADDCCKTETKIIVQLSETSFKDVDYKLVPAVIDAGIVNKIFGREFTQSSVLTLNNSFLKFQLPESGRNILSLKSVLIV